MEELNRIDVQGRDLIVSLPYRVGLWVGQSDEVGGEHSVQEEAEALQRILRGFTEEVFGSEVVQHVMDQTWRRREEWSTWQGQLDTVPEQCQTALNLLFDADIDEKEVSAYKQRLIEIAEAVAFAFREYDELGFIQRVRMMCSYHIARYKAAKKQLPFQTMEQYLSVSVKERVALRRLAGALGLSYI